MAAKIFISYRSSDIELSRELRERLLENNFDVWRDKEEILPGDDWQKTIHDGLKECTHLLLIMTPEALASTEVESEWSYFIGEKKTIIPLLMRECKDVPYRLRLYNHIDFSTDRPKAYETLFRFLHSRDPKTNDPVEEIIPDEAIEAITWERVQKAAADYNSAMLATRYQEKYAPESFFQRAEADHHLDEFLNSDKSLLVLTGKAGTGKSSLICHFATHPPEGSVTWLQDCGSLDVDNNLAVHFMETLFLPAAPHRVFEHLFKNNPGVKFVAIFDAVNQYKDTRRLLSSIAELAELGQRFPNFKIILTARLPVWSVLRLDFDFPAQATYRPSGDDVVMDIFEENEVKEAYKGYQEAFELEPDYDDLTAQVKTFIRQPLFLKLTARAYSKQRIPTTLVLKEVFEKYILDVLGKEGVQGADYKLLARLVELMYQHAQQELNFNVLKSNQVVSDHIEGVHVDPANPFMRLLDEGIISHRETLLRRIEGVFITYERVFEYLLADIVIGMPQPDTIKRILEEASSRHFPPLRGAAELAVCFRLLKENPKDKTDAANLAWFVQLAEADHPESRQFIINIIETIHDAGRTDLVIKIMDQLQLSGQDTPKLVAIQAAYSLKMDAYLVNLSLSKEPLIKDTAAVYIYERWNTERRTGDLDSAYQIVNLITDKISLTSPSRIGPGFSTLMILSFNIASHVIDDPDAIRPLLAFYKNAVRRIPGLEPRSGGVLGFVRERGVSVLLSIIAQVVARIMHSTIFQNQEQVKDLLTEPRNKHIMVEMANFINLDSLENSTDKLLECLKAPNSLIPWLYRGVMMHFINRDPETHVPLLSELFDAEELNFIARFDIAYSLVFGSVVRLLRKQTVDLAVMEDVETMFDLLWADYHRVIDGIESGNPVSDIPNLTAKYHALRMEALLTGIYTIESVTQPADRPGSEFLRNFAENVPEAIDQRGLSILIHGLEKFAYRGSPSFAIRSMLDKEVHGIWERDDNLRSIVVGSLSRLRALYPKEVDTLVHNYDKAHQRNLLDLVRSRGDMPVADEVRSLSNSLWTLALAVEPTVMKVAGAGLLELAQSETVSRFVEHVIRTAITALFDLKDIDALIAAWFICHDPTWDQYAKWEMAPDIAEQRPTQYAAYKQMITEYMDKYGAGLVFGREDQ